MLKDIAKQLGFTPNASEINAINSHINAIADILATNDLDKDFKTAILRQIKSIKAILRKEVLK